MAQAALPPAARLPLLGLAVLALVSGVVAGLARLGLNVPDFGPPLAAMHGALLVAAFFAAVISLERAVALGAAPAYLAPAAAGLGGLSLIARAPEALAQALCATAALLLLLESLLIWQRQRTLHTATLAFGAGALCAGDLVWALAGATAAVPWWFAFLLLTIAGERLELTRLLPAAPGSKRAFTAILALLLAGAAVAGAGLGWLPYAAALALFALWLLRHDIARRTVRQAGLTRYIAVCLLAGYFWLLAAGLFGLAGAFAAGHAWRDAALHALALGFVLSMVFGHAPIIIPAVARIKLPWHALFYLPLALLHASLALRVAAGLAGDMVWRQAGAAGNAAALAVFVLTVLAGVWRGRRRPART